MKKIITFLGTGNYQEVMYKGMKHTGDAISVHTRFVQEAICRIVGEDSMLYVGLTEFARKKNWESGIHRLRDFETCKITEVHKMGLKETLDNNNIAYKDFYLKDGKNEKEMWENFDGIFNILDEGDEVYVDVTHSFRSIPFIIMSILNYAKFIKNIDIKGIYYGAFEASENGVAPIFDLSLFNQLTDWTIGAEKFISSGNSNEITNIISTTIQPILASSKGKHDGASISRNINNSLKAFSGSIYAVRGNRISEDGSNLKESLEDIEGTNIDKLKPFERILGKIYEKVRPYTEDLVSDIHTTVKLCREFGLIQQAYTFLAENILTYLCIKGQYDFMDPCVREDVKTVLLSKHKQKHILLNEIQKEVEVHISKYINPELANLFDSLGDDYRNDINHAGYRSGPKAYKQFDKRINDFILAFESLALKNENKDALRGKIQKMILIFSHKLTEDQIEEAKDVLGIKMFINLPEELQKLWGSIPPYLENISDITKKIKQFISSVSDEKDYVLVQGDFGATYDVVGYCKSIGRVPIYSTTERKAAEKIRNDEIIEIAHIFKHVQFRRY